MQGALPTAFCEQGGILTQLKQGKQRVRASRTMEFIISSPPHLTVFEVTFSSTKKLQQGLKNDADPVMNTKLTN